MECGHCPSSRGAVTRVSPVVSMQPNHIQPFGNLNEHLGEWRFATDANENEAFVTWDICLNFKGDYVAVWCLSPAVPAPTKSEHIFRQK